MGLSTTGMGSVVFLIWDSLQGHWGHSAVFPVKFSSYSRGPKMAVLVLMLNFRWYCLDFSQPPQIQDVSLEMFYLLPLKYILFKFLSSSLVPHLPFTPSNLWQVGLSLGSQVVTLFCPPYPHKPVSVLRWALPCLSTLTTDAQSSHLIFFKYWKEPWWLHLNPALQLPTFFFF